ncbi:hypothetical protein MML48_3g00004821 [Holotrichia oblita]|uniref:Uncharacterized protein n=1 Tax=Holotrichia oblita TaxID=644536 RepID=A0ACB9TH92_HOLOL|nr:hypothetical protein MML48_3g00004821 [Holotrichia oblita]
MNNYTAPQKQNIQAEKGEQKPFPIIMYVYESGKKKREWVHKINLDRNKFGEYHTFMLQLQEDEKRFYIYFRMPSECFEEILCSTKEDISKQITNYRVPVSVEERPVLTLRFLATSDSYSTIGHSFRIGFETVSQIVQEICHSICKSVGHMYLPEPTTEIWEESEKGFADVWQFPNCIGSVDGKHVTIKCPNKSRKKIDGGIFEASNMGQRFEAGQMNVPNYNPLPGENKPCSHVLVGDEAFALKPYLMRSFLYRQSRIDPRKENYNISRARGVVENVFGILAQRWRILFRPMTTKIETIVQTACVLHNFLCVKRSDNQYYELLEPPKQPVYLEVLNIINEEFRN